MGQGVNSGPPPAATLTGYCFGTIAGIPNKCAVVQDLAHCPVGQVAAQPGFVVGCLPPTSRVHRCLDFMSGEDEQVAEPRPDG